MSQSVFGWVISGNTSEEAPQVGLKPKSLVVHHCISNNALDKSIKKFFEIEDLPQKRIASLEDEKCEAHFRDTHSHTKDGWYIERIPFKAPLPIKIVESRHRSEICLKRIENRLAKDDDLRKQYAAFMHEYELLNHMQLYKDLPDEYKSQKPVFISHHPVIKAESITTKLRVVFNASGKTSNNTSLDDHTYKGPALQADLPTILQNWRSYKYIFTADINEIYRQILVNLKDVWSQCILWRDGPLLLINEY